MIRFSKVGLGVPLDDDSMDKRQNDKYFMKEDIIQSLAVESDLSKNLTISPSQHLYQHMRPLIIIIHCSVVLSSLFRKGTHLRKRDNRHNNCKWPIMQQLYSEVYLLHSGHN